MTTETMTSRIEEFFQRSLTAHMPPEAFEKLQKTSVLVAGLGGGSNIAELLARKGFGRIVIADLDTYEPHNVRQRGSLISTQGQEKVRVMHDRLRDIYPGIEIVPVHEGITMDNADRLAKESDFIVEMLDFSALAEKIALHRAARQHGRFALTAPSVINGAVLWVFDPAGMTFEQFIGYREGMTKDQLGPRLLKRAIPHYPPEAAESLYQAAARGERTIPLDAVGVDQAAVMAVGAVENMALGRFDRVVTFPRGIQIDVSDPSFLARIIDLTHELKG